MLAKKLVFLSAWPKRWRRGDGLRQPPNRLPARPRPRTRRSRTCSWATPRMTIYPYDEVEVMPVLGIRLEELSR